jgi:hypothetical protein
MLKVLSAEFIERFRRQITWRVTQPQREPKDEAERQQRERLRELMARLKRAVSKENKQ